MANKNDSGVLSGSGGTGEGGLTGTEGRDSLEKNMSVPCCEDDDDDDDVILHSPPSSLRASAAALGGMMTSNL